MNAQAQQQAAQPQPVRRATIRINEQDMMDNHLLDLIH